MGCDETETGTGSCLQSELRFGTAQRSAEYGWICCENHTKVKAGQPWTVDDGIAEPQGSLREPPVDLFDKAHDGMVFYDSKCGIPLFQLGARPVEVWKAESNHNGWPSFRDEEVVQLYENVIEMHTGEVVSSCGTHLGRNKRDRDGNRYSVNLLCISGKMAKNAKPPPGVTTPAPVLEETTSAP
jgi:peptide methionine sulfoxide reductase MsrB